MSMMSMSMSVNEKMSRMLLNIAEEFSIRAVKACADHYNFDGEEAIRLLGLENIKMESKKSSRASSGVKKSEKVKKVKAAKSEFPLPYSGVLVDEMCYALRQNNGLYTQCTVERKEDGSYCKGCEMRMLKSGLDKPEFGTIQDRMAVGMFEYVDPKGRKPTPYVKIMKKYNLSKEQVMEEAGKQNVSIDEKHFDSVDTTSSKRGRPKGEEKPKKEGKKGRPKKEKKVIELEGETEDLFAKMVAAAVMSEDDQSNDGTEDLADDFDQKLAELAEITEEAVAAEKAEKEKADKAEKEAQRLKEKAEKEALKQKEKEEKEAKIAAEKAEKEALKLKEKAEKEAKIAAEKAEKEAKKKAEEEAKKLKEAEKAEKANKKKVPEKKAEKMAEKKIEIEDEEEEQDVVKKIVFEDKKYLKSKKTGIVYDYNEYVNNGEQVVVGKWNESDNKIDFNDAEESEEEYDE